jgi:ATP-dependent helicase/nuclease subunit B
MFLDKVRAIELAVLRGPRPSPGLLGIQRALELKSEDKLAKWVSEFRLAIGFTKVSTNEKLPLSDLLRAHISFADWLSSSKDKGQSKSIWLGDPGEALAMFIKELLNVAEESPQLTLSEYPAYLDALLKNEVVRPRYGKHPRLFIWSPLEARLQYVDLMILGGLNEGTWPPEADSDPWMSHSMREELGLPPHERRIGLSAHDFVQCCGAPEVMLTRSQNIDGEPTVPSRWLLRIKTLLQTNSLNESFEKASHQWLWLQSLMDRPEVPAKASIPPKPCPPIEARPRKLSVTQIETWLRNPYEIYASHILHLRPIDSIDADPSAADKGTVIHDILYHFLHEFGTRLPSNAFDRLLEIGREKFSSFEEYPSLMAFWWPRFERVAKWFIEYETEWRKSAIPLGGEVSGSLTISAPKGDFVIYAKADRIDQFADGGLVIIDYKTGSVPSDRLVRSGRYPQLPIEALIAETGGFNGISVEKVKCLAYLQLTGGQPAGKARFIKENIDTTIACTKKGLIDLINKFDDVTTPYSSIPSTDAKISWNNYAHLERFQEWFSREIGDA